MTHNITDWFRGNPRQSAVSNLFTVVDGEEIEHNTDEWLADLARRIMESKTSRSYLERYAPELGWDFVAQRLAAGPQKVRRGDFGEVVACGWLEDYAMLLVPVKKLRSQINPGQTLPSTDAVAFQIVDGVVKNAYFLEAKLRTKNVMLTSVARNAYKQLAEDRRTYFREILQYAHEQLYYSNSPLLDAVTDYLKRRTPADEDGHEIVLILERDIWIEEILTELDEVAGELPNCRVHSLLAEDLATVADQAFAKAGMELIDEMKEE
jgi:hypothetical protein